MSHHQLPYEKIVHDAGFRLTSQRECILDAVCAGDGHTTLGEIYRLVRQRLPAVNRSTVYRTLHLFVSLGLVVSANPGDGNTYYEIAKPQRHHHLVCRECGLEQEINDAPLEQVFQYVLDTYGFRANTDHVLLFGRCAACQGKAL